MRQGFARVDAVTSSGSGEVPGGWVLRYLLDIGILQPGDAVHRTASAEDVSVSHRAFLVRIGGNPRWFVKQADPVRSRGRDLGAEAAVYRLASTEPAVSTVMPRCVAIGEQNQILVLDALPAEPLHILLTRARPGAAEPTALLRAYGGAVARAHRVRPPRFGQPPWLLVALEPRWGGYEWLPAGCAQLLRKLAANPAFPERFRQLRREWRATALIHGDIRWANALGRFDGGRPRVWIVDWELACRGDPSWDVGSLIADVVSMAAFTETRMDVAATCASLLEGYREVARPPEDQWRRLLEVSTQTAAVRMVQTIVEYGHSSDADLAVAERALMPWAVAFLNHPASVAEAVASGQGLNHA